MPQVIPFLPLITAGAGLGLQAYQGNVASRRAEHAQEDSLNTYNAVSKPEPVAVEAQATQNRGALGQARLGSYQNLASNLASRGFGSGSGLGIKGAADIEKGYLRGLGESQTELTKFANTRQFGPPGSVYGTSVPSGLENALGGGSDLLSRALGMFMASRALGGSSSFGNLLGFGGGGGSSSGSSNPWGQQQTGLPGFF